MREQDYTAGLLIVANVLLVVSIIFTWVELLGY